MMRSLAETTGCRGQGLLAYFGEHAPDRCGHCDNCEQRPQASPHANGAARAASAAARVPGERSSRPTETPWPVHSQVEHAAWGVGMVLRYEEDTMTLLFDEVGYKTLSVPVVRRQNLLTAID